MHGERDLLTRYIFPELRNRAKAHRLNVFEVDLRWGVTEAEASSHQAIELCLSEIGHSQVFVGLLGQRYGWVPDQYKVPAEQRFDWLQTYPQKRSITELEMYAAALHDETAAKDRAFFLIRDDAFVEQVPNEVCLGI